MRSTAAVLLATLFATTTALAQVPAHPVATLYAQPEGIAITQDGDIYVSLAFVGDIVELKKDGSTRLITTLNVGNGFLVGLAVDRRGLIYAALASFDENAGVWRVNPRTGEAKLFASLPFDAVKGVFNALAFDRHGNLYVTDSTGGLVYRIDDKGKATLWSDSPLLRGRDPDPFGANGIVVLRGKVYVGITDAGVVVEIPIESDGSAGPARDWVQDDSLGGTDGLAADVAGNLYVVSNWLNTVVRVSPDRRLKTVVAGGLDAPASIAFGRGRDWRYLYITNFSWETGINHIARAKLDTPGRP